MVLRTVRSSTEMRTSIGTTAGSESPPYLNAPANYPVSGFPLSAMKPIMGRAVIAMTAVRRGVAVEPGKTTGRSVGCPPTDVMAITSLPQYTATSHLETNNT